MRMMGRSPTCDVMAAAPSEQAAAAPRIQRLSTEVVNRIAAGEVVHRPANAIKELLENALDAGATHIAVTVSQGGLKLLQIQDNGSGIQRQDLDIVCERFTTSKLRTFEDLREIQSFGFRGEALASISHVAHVTITSKTAEQPCAYKYVRYYGLLVAKRPGASKDPTPCAGKNGTQIMVEDLFYNLSTRKQALKNTSEQYSRILDVVQNLRKSHFILFINNRLVECPALKRACEYVYSLYLPKSTHPFIYLSMELPPRNIDVNVHPTKREVRSTAVAFRHIVDSISQAIEKQLKGSNESRSFSVQPITAMLGISSRSNSDVSAKQRRRESVLDDEEKTQQAESSEEEEVERDSEGEADQTVVQSQSIELDLSQKQTPPSRKYQAALRLVRTDHRSNTIDKYYFLESQRSQLSQSPPDSQVTPERRSAMAQQADDAMDSDSDGVAASNPRKRKFSETEKAPGPEPEPEEDDDRRSSLEATQSPQMLSSVQNLLSLLRNKKNKALGRLFREHSFVGVVDKQYSLVQYRTKLYIVRHDEVAFHVFYQQVLLQFGVMQPINLQKPLPVYELVVEALKNPRNGYDEEDGPKEQLADEIKTLLVANGPMLAEYFSIDIDSQGMLRTLPRLLPDHEPSIHSLPEFVFQLATEVNWEEEEPCFEGVAQALARWYGEMRYPASAEREALVLEHVLFPATKAAAFSPPNELNDAQLITPVACLTNLYKIFERC
ncbi:hypothetical protein BBJ28_00016585 [Nothophytophthora sp. Chile5]|nr:hypothetical protein BBJ28_00016585 [Nothophytophthora sp. Chile5]